MVMLLALVPVIGFSQAWIYKYDPHEIIHHLMMEGCSMQFNDEVTLSTAKKMPYDVTADQMAKIFKNLSAGCTVEHVYCENICNEFSFELWRKGKYRYTCFVQMDAATRKIKYFEYYKNKN